MCAEHEGAVLVEVGGEIGNGVRDRGDRDEGEAYSSEPRDIGGGKRNIFEETEESQGTHDGVAGVRRLEGTKDNAGLFVPKVRQGAREVVEVIGVEGAAREVERLALEEISHYLIHSGGVSSMVRGYRGVVEM